MTQATASGKAPAAPAPKVVNLPPATMPLVTRAWSRAPFSDEKFGIKAGETILWWLLDKPHPLLPTHKIVRMFVVPGGAVEVFSTDIKPDGQGGEVGTRHTIPWHQVTFIEEAMDPQTFVDEIAAAEAGEEEEEEEEDGEDVSEGLQPLPGAAVPALPANGSGSSS